MRRDEPTIRRMSEERNSVVKILSERWRVWMQRLRVESTEEPKDQVIEADIQRRRLSGMLYGTRYLENVKLYQDTPMDVESNHFPPWAKD